MTVTEGESDAAEILRSTPPPDDSGAQTADRYEWQAMMAAADVLAVYFRSLDADGNVAVGANFTVICEHHEDWALLVGSESEIVSGKHRETSVGPFSTYRQILADGGVLHLFDRWQALQQTPLCRLVTTGGLKGDAARLTAACEHLRLDPATQDVGVVEAVASLTQGIAALKATGGTMLAEETDVTIRAFMASLYFQHSEATRDHLPDMAGERYGRPVAERVGRVEAAGAVWQAVLALVRARMRAAGPSFGGALPRIMAVPHDTALAPRSLTLADVTTAVRIALSHTTGYEPLPRIVMANRMAVKMARGGCSDNAIERAEDLRLQYRRYWRTLRSSPTTSDRQRQVANTLSRVIDEVTDTVRVETGPWGASLWRELGTKFRAMEGETDAHGLRADLLLGGASELANNCRVWYSDRFDAQGELRRMVAEEAAS